MIATWGRWAWRTSWWTRSGWWYIVKRVWGTPIQSYNYPKSVKGPWGPYLHAIVTSRSHIPRNEKIPSSPYSTGNGVHVGYPTQMKSTPKKTKCTQPAREICVWDPLQPIFHWLALGFCVGANTNLKICIGGNTNYSVFRYQHVGISNAKFRVRGLSQRKDPTQMFLRRSGI